MVRLTGNGHKDIKMQGKELVYFRAILANVYYFRKMNLIMENTKHMNRTTRFLTAFFCLALCFCGCSRLPSRESPVMEEVSAGVYKVTIPAVIYDLPVAFKASDKIYLYDDTQGVFACDQNGQATVLHPGDLNENGTECVLRGQVSFYRYNVGTGQRTLVPVGENDAFRLLLNVSEVNTGDPGASVFTYEGQDGTKENAYAHFYAETTAVKMNAPGSVVRFFGMQSLLTAGMSFRRDGVVVEPTLAKLTVTTDHDALARSMRVLDGEIRTDKMVLTHPSASELYLSLASRHGDEVDRLVFQAVDTEGRVYDAYAEMPQGGLMAGTCYDCRLIFNHNNEATAD